MRTTTDRETRPESRPKAESSQHSADALAVFEARPSVASKPSWLWMIGLTLGAAALRLPTLGHWSLSGDEIYSHYDALGVDLDDWGSTPWGVRHYPLVYVLIRLAYEVFGQSELAARLFPALFGIAAVPAIYWALSRFTRQAVARWAALLILLSPWHLFNSQNARFYSAVFFFGGAGMLLVFSALERNRARNLWAGLICLGLATLSHPSGGLAMGAVVVYVLLIALLPGFERPPGLNRRILLPPGILLGVVAVLASPKAYDLIMMRKSSQLREAVYDTTHLISALIFNIGPHLCLMALVGAVVLLWRRNRLGLFLVSIAAIPIVSLILLSFKFSTGHRYAFSVAPAVFILAAVGIAAVVKLVRTRSLACAVAVASIFLLYPSSSLLSYYQDGDRHDFRGAAEQVAASFEVGDVILAESHGYVEHYAPGLYALELPMPWERMQELARRNRRVWCIVKAGRSGVLQDPHGATESWVNLHGCLVARISAPRYDYHLNELRIYLCEIPENG
ncbi:MAG: glycosyltransferase family 39 protein [Planctomycetota bacterium]